MSNNKKKIALVLLSGGLDSILAARFIADTGRFFVVGYYFQHPFASKSPKIDSIERQAHTLGIPLIVDSDDDGFIDMVKHPQYGVGKGANPCVDCKVFMIKRAFRVLQAMNGDFLVSGEVVGQRPMSQLKHTLLRIDKLADVRGVLLRPLSGKILPPTLPENEGWISHNELLDISGRGRNRQIELAQSLGVTDFPMPAGGCLLTEVEFSKRVIDLIENNKDFGKLEVEALKFGRHFRLPSGLKAIVARDDSDSEKVLCVLAGRYWIITTSEIPGPWAALNRKPSQDELVEVAGIVAGYSKARLSETVAVEVVSPEGTKISLSVHPLDKRDYSRFLL